MLRSILRLNTIGIKFRPGHFAKQMLSAIIKQFRRAERLSIGFPSNFVFRRLLLISLCVDRRLEPILRHSLHGIPKFRGRRFHSLIPVKYEIIMSVSFALLSSLYSPSRVSASAVIRFARRDLIFHMAKMWTLWEMRGVVAFVDVPLPGEPSWNFITRGEARPLVQEPREPVERLRAADAAGAQPAAPRWVFLGGFPARWTGVGNAALCHRGNPTWRIAHGPRNQRSSAASGVNTAVKSIRQLPRHPRGHTFACTKRITLLHRSVLATRFLRSDNFKNEIYFSSKDEKEDNYKVITFWTILQFRQR